MAGDDFCRRTFRGGSIIPGALVVKQTSRSGQPVTPPPNRILASPTIRLLRTDAERAAVLLPIAMWCDACRNVPIRLFMIVVGAVPPAYEIPASEFQIVLLTCAEFVVL